MSGRRHVALAGGCLLAALVQWRQHVTADAIAAASGVGTAPIALPVLPAVAMLVALALVGYGVGPPSALRRALRTLEQPLPGRTEALLLVGILALAAALRFLWLETIPAQVMWDESANALIAHNILARDVRPVFVASFSGREPLLGYLIAGSFWLFGVGIFTLRLASALIGVAIVAGTFLLVRELAGPRLALLAAFALAVSRWAITLNRIAVRPPLVALLGVLMLWFLVRAWRRRSAVDYALSGLCLGLGMYSYPAFRIAPLLVVVWMALGAAIWRKAPRQAVTGAALLSAVALAATAPLVVFALDQPDAFWGRVQSVSGARYAGNVGESVVRTTMRNVVDTLGMLVLVGPDDTQDGIRLAPILGWAEGTLFSCGAVATFRLLAFPRPRLLLVALGLGLVPTLLAQSLEGGHPGRAYGVLPAIATFTAIGIAIVWTRVDASLHRPVALSPGARGSPQRHEGHEEVTLSPAPLCSLCLCGEPVVPSPEPSPSPRRRGGQGVRSVALSLVALGAVLILPAVLGAADYFGRYAPQHQTSVEQAVIGVARQAAGYALVYVTPQMATPSIEAMLYPDTPWFQLGGGGIAGVAGRADRDVVVVVYPSQHQVLAGLSAEYPGTVVSEHAGPNGGAPLLLSARISAGVLREQSDHAPGWTFTRTPPRFALAPADSHGLIGRYYADRSLDLPPWLGTPAQVRLDPVPAGSPLPGPGEQFSVVWDGLILIERAGIHRFAVASEGTSLASVTIDGRVIARKSRSDRTAQGDTALSPGTHPIRVTYAHERGRPSVQVVWSPPGQTARPLDSQVLIPAGLRTECRVLSTEYSALSTSQRHTVEWEEH
ncbi:MAG: glycosyltransferase family 39 protein [Chloroflexi bacterium]|nr:glycosyltransferase family 39 protein [Chloroflexota bacterium]